MKDLGNTVLPLCFGISGNHKYHDHLHNCGVKNLHFFTDL